MKKIKRQIKVIRPPRAEMQKNIARFDELEGFDGGLPDMLLDDCHRIFLNVLGFEPPTIPGATSPFGAASRPKIRGMKPGFGVSFVACEPGHGTVMHAHDTNETFMAVTGKWKMEWEDAEGTHHEVLNPRDVCSFPVGIQRLFKCVEVPPGEKTALLLAIIGGDAPNAEYSPEATARMVREGILEDVMEPA
ncbi:MAG: cupin domain-containing protein [Alphaproteobacteria bacterium]